MKKMILIAIMNLSAGFAMANDCHFPYDLAEDEGVNVVRSFEITTDTRLTSLQKRQVLITARRATEGTEFTSAQEAIETMREWSEGGDLYYKVFQFEGEIYSAIELYPGGNPYGVIFQGTKVIAERHDGDIVCQ